MYIILLCFCTSCAENGRAGKPSLLSCIVSLLPIPVFVVVNKPDNVLFHLLSVQWQTQQSPKCFSLLALQFLCAVHKYLFASMVVLYWQRGRKSMPPSLHVLLFPPLLRLRAVRCPTSKLGSTHPAFNMLPSLTMHHPVLLLSFCHRVLFVLSLCILYLSVRRSLLTFSSSFQLSPRVYSLCVSSSPDHRSFLSNT